MLDWATNLSYAAIAYKKFDKPTSNIIYLIKISDILLYETWANLVCYLIHVLHKGYTLLYFSSYPFILNTLLLIL
jgi:hypothetical protein